jgi:hypothetical protein
MTAGLLGKNGAYRAIDMAQAPVATDPPKP